MLVKVLFAISILLNIFLIYISFVRWNSKPDYTGPDNHEFLRVTSPDSVFDVVFEWESEGGALGNSSYQAYIVPKGTKPIPRTQFLDGTYIDSCKVTWEGPEAICVHYSKARILNFNTPVFMRYGEGKHRLIDIELCSE